VATLIRQNARWSQPKILLVSSIGSLSLSKSDAEAIDGYLTKPVRHDDLMARAASVLGHAVVADAPELMDETPQVLAQLHGRVLLVEDNPVNQVLAMETLTQAGATVEIASNGQEGCVLAAAQEFDIILMDVQMPVLDGYGAARHIRGLGGRLETVPIIAMTANAMTGDRERCMEAGMDDYIPKPIDPDQLIVSLRRWMTAKDDIEPTAEEIAALHSAERVA